MKNILYQIAIICLFTSTTQAQQRIISAGSSSSEIVCALGFYDKIVATDRTSLYPEQLQQLPSIGYRTGISAEGIIAQNPDLIILEKEYVKQDLVTQLQATGIKTLLVTQDGTLASTKERITQIAKALGKEKEGKALIAKIEKDLDALEKKKLSQKEEPTVLCVYARGQGSMQVAGNDAGFSIITLAGAKNAVPEISGFKPLNAESLIQANPDYILFFNSGLKSIGGIEEVLKTPGVLQTTAGKQRQIISMDGLLLTNWGPRIAEAAYQLFELTHPKAAH